MDDELFLDRLKINCSIPEKTSSEVIGDALPEFTGNANKFVVMFQNIRKMLLLGGSVSSSFKAGIRQLKLKDKELESRLIQISDCDDARSAIERVCAELAYCRRFNLETGFGSLQKYLTVSLLVTVILPSLSLFSFVGYTMLYNSSIAFIAFSALLISVFPISFAVIERKISEFYVQ